MDSNKMGKVDWWAPAGLIRGLGIYDYMFPDYDIYVRDTKWGKSIELQSNEAREYVFQVTGIHYSTINLPTDDSLLTALLLKFKQ